MAPQTLREPCSSEAAAGDSAAPLVPGAPASACTDDSGAWRNAEIAAIRCPEKEAKLVQLIGWGPLDFPYDLKDLRVELRPVFNWILKQLQGQRDAIALLARTVQPWDDVVRRREDSAASRDAKVEDGRGTPSADPLAFDALALDWMVRTQQAMDGLRAQSDAAKEHQDVLDRRVDQIFEDVLQMRQGNQHIYLFSNGAAPFGVKWGRAELPKALADLERELVNTSCPPIPSGHGEVAACGGPAGRPADEAAVRSQRHDDALPTCSTPSSASRHKPEGFANTRQEIDAMICRAMLDEREESLRQYRRAVSMLHDSLEVLRTRVEELSGLCKTSQRRHGELESSLEEQCARLISLEQHVEEKLMPPDMQATGASGHASPSGVGTAGDLMGQFPIVSEQGRTPDPEDAMAGLAQTPTKDALLHAVDVRLGAAMSTLEDRLDGLRAWVHAAIGDGSRPPAPSPRPATAPGATMPRPVGDVAAPGDGVGGACLPQPTSGPTAFYTAQQRKPPSRRPGSVIGPPPRTPPEAGRHAGRGRHSASSSPPRAPLGGGVEVVASAAGRDSEMMARLPQAPTKDKIAKLPVPNPGHGVRRPCTASGHRPARGLQAVARDPSLEGAKRSPELAVTRPPTR